MHLQGRGLGSFWAEERSVVICWELGKNYIKFTVTFWAILGLRGYHTVLLVEWFPQFPTKCTVFEMSRTTFPKLCSLMCGISLKTWYRRHFLKPFFASYYVLHRFFFSHALVFLIITYMEIVQEQQQPRHAYGWWWGWRGKQIGSRFGSHIQHESRYYKCHF